jgi:S-formylglutathione hydrolase FrmB
MLAVNVRALLLLVGAAAQPAPLAFELTFSRQALAEPFSGRVFVVVSKQPLGDAPHRQNWFKPEPFFAQDVKNWLAETPLHFEASHAFPHPLAKVPAGKYHVQAILDRDQGGQNALTAPGNLYSKALTVELDPAKSGVVKLTIDQTVPQRKFEEKANVKLVDIESKLLSMFHGKPMRLRAGVVLPKSFAAGEAPHPQPLSPKGRGEQVRRYPVVYEIPGFGGDHFMAHAAALRDATNVAGEEMIWVMLDPSCRLGHHVFADSANNGPVGQALIEELIPHIEKTYRGLGVPGGRFVTGHSSGGWSSLWLQVTYPNFFGGVWSTAPDPVDFRDFQLVDIYEPGANLFFDAKGELRPLARRGGKVALHYKPFSDMEVVLGRGGQLFSFEAVFSPRGPDGQPRPLWDRSTGRIDPVTAEAWKNYDIRLILEKNWDTLPLALPATDNIASLARVGLKSKLAGKIHIYMGAEDTFYLDGATRLLQESLKKLGSDAVVEIFPGRDHGTLIDTALRQRIAREMAEQYRRQAGHLETPEEAARRHEAVARRRGKVVVLCHRGAQEFAHENTLEAYRATLELGGDGNEIDIRRTKDGVLVCFHDDMLDRLLEAYGTVAETTWAELRSFPFREPGPLGKDCRIPTLREVLLWHRRHGALVHLDIKEPGLDQAIAELLEELDMWDHVAFCNDYNSAALLKHPKLKLLRYRGGLFQDRLEVDPAAIAAVLKRPGEGVIVDDPRGVLLALGRRLGQVSKEPVAPLAKPPSPAVPSTEFAVLRAKLTALTDRELIKVVRDAEDWNQVAQSAEDQAKSGARIRARALATELLLMRKVDSAEARGSLAERVQRRSLHKHWMYHGFDGAMALRTLILSRAPAAVELARFVLWRDDPELRQVHNPEFKTPVSWTDFRVQMVIFPALEKHPGAATEQLCRDYLALSDEAARQHGPPQFEAAARTLLTVRPEKAVAVELLKHRRSDVRGRAILTCLQQVRDSWARAALEEAAPHALAYLQK